MYPLDDTICAIATAPGVGGVGIVRLSGVEAFSIAQRAFQSPHAIEKKREVLFGKFMDPSKSEILDEGLLLVMPRPASYTGEDVVEFHAHGSPTLLSRLVEVLVALGARPAEPGEFTYRAFVQGRLDLTQAEAVEALVSAQGEASRRQALRQLTGGLAAHLEPLEESLKALYIKIEARLEFSEDGIPPLDVRKFKEEMAAIRREFQKLLQSYEHGKVLREGLTVALVGPPNVGKSSLLNSLLGADRAIVTPMAGTTRDVVEGEMRLKGVKVRFFDTAGIRKAENEVEVEGIRRSRQVMEEADILFWLVDASNPDPSLQEAKAASMPVERTWFLFNKLDLVKKNTSSFKDFLTTLSERSEHGMSGPKGYSNPSKGLRIDRCLGLSCVTQEGMPQVFEKIEALIQMPLTGEDTVLTSARHQKEIQNADQALDRLETLIKNKESYELWAEELKEATLAIGRIRGRNLPATAFAEIFSKFCIGK